jgi:hypothetical protein
MIVLKGFLEMFLKSTFMNDKEEKFLYALQEISIAHKNGHAYCKAMNDIVLYLLTE